MGGFSETTFNPGNNSTKSKAQIHKGKKKKIPNCFPVPFLKEPPGVFLLTIGYLTLSPVFLIL